VAQNLSISGTQRGERTKFKYTDDPSAPVYWDEACEFLITQHPAWVGLINRHRDRALRSRGDAFQTLARAITGQQISVKAADAVWGRVEALFENALEPVAALKLRVEALRAAGLSGRKVEYMYSLAQFALDGGLAPALLGGLSDEECLKHLIQIKGIGRWTAEMFLIFNLRRPDVWPVDDLGLLKAIGWQLLGHTARANIEKSKESSVEQPMPDAKLANQLGETLRPWRTVATWYLWRSLDPIAVDY